MQVSEEGSCIKWQGCMPSRHNRASFIRLSYIQSMQENWIDRYNCFLSNGRLYANVILGNNKRIVDAITGTLYDGYGRCLTEDTDLMVDIDNVIDSKEEIKKFVNLNH